MLGNLRIYRFCVLGKPGVPSNIRKKPPAVAGLDGRFG